MKSLETIKSSIYWDEIIDKIRNDMPEKTEDIYEYFLRGYNEFPNNIFSSVNDYYKFLSDFWFKFDPIKIPKYKMENLYKIKNNEITNNEKLFYFFAKRIDVPFEYFEVLLHIHIFLLEDQDRIKTDEDKEYYNLYWSCLFKQQNIPVDFIKKYYIFFLNNKKFFKDMICSNKVLFKLDQIIINKFKSN